MTGSLAETLSRCDTTAFITAIALVAEAKRRERTRPLMADIQRLVCARFNVATAEMQSGARARRIARPRQIAMYLAYQPGTRSKAQIGRFFAGRTSWTVLHACRQIERLRGDDPDIEAAIVELTGELTP